MIHIISCVCAMIHITSLPIHIITPLVFGILYTTEWVWFCFFCTSFNKIGLLGRWIYSWSAALPIFHKPTWRKTMLAKWNQASLMMLDNVWYEFLFTMLLTTLNRRKWSLWNRFSACGMDLTLLACCIEDKLIICWIVLTLQGTRISMLALIRS